MNRKKYTLSWKRVKELEIIPCSARKIPQARMRVCQLQLMSTSYRTEWPLERFCNNMYQADTENYTSWRSNVTPNPNRRVSITSLRKTFNEMVCINHFCPNGSRIVQCIDLVSGSSVVHIVKKSGVMGAILKEKCGGIVGRRMKG